MNDILDKITKLKKHAESADAIGNEAEATAFAEMMQRLLAKHKLSMSDVEFHAYQTSNPVGQHSIDYTKYPDVEMKNSRQSWIEKLAGIVGRAHNCRFLVHPGSSRITLVGRKHEAEQCEFVLVTLQRYMERASERARHEYYHAHVADWRTRNLNVTLQMRGYRDNWLMAFVSRLSERYEEERRRLQHEATTSSVALVRVSDLKVVDDWMKEKVDGKKRFSSAGGLGPVARTGHADGQRHGRTAADAVNLRSNAVGPSAPTRQLPDRGGR